MSEPIRYSLDAFLRNFDETTPVATILRGAARLDPNARFLESREPDLEDDSIAFEFEGTKYHVQCYCDGSTEFGLARSNFDDDGELASITHVADAAPAGEILALLGRIENRMPLFAGDRRGPYLVCGTGSDVVREGLPLGDE